MSLPGKQAIGMDFDGVVHSYTSGWQGYDVVADPPVEGVREAIEEMRKTHNVIIYSCRASDPGGLEAIKRYLAKHSIEVDGVTDRKPVAEFIVDDRAVRFNGDWQEVLKTFRAGFVPWNKWKLDWKAINAGPEATIKVVELRTEAVVVEGPSIFDATQSMPQAVAEIRLQITFPPEEEMDQVVMYERCVKVLRKILGGIDA